MSFNIKKYIIYEDNELIALNKPEGLLSIPDGYNLKLSNLRDLLIRKYGSIYTVHRLDKGTSGAIIFAKNKETHAYLNNLFQNRKIRKTYYAIVHGVPMWAKRKIEWSLKPNGDRHHRTIVVKDKGKKALSYIQVICRINNTSFLQILPVTGYRHQIRSQLAAVGYPIFGDKLYAYQRSKNNLELITKPSNTDRMYLHASTLFLQLKNQRILKISAPLPKKFLKMLRGF
jgi:RluA family pseudouridine synthase